VKKDYEIALSYAHKDKDIADMVGKELEDIFAGGFFMDELRPEELANADPFRQKLRNIFERSAYAVILYSENYRKGQFTTVEMEKILEKEERGSESRCFIINIDDCRGIDEQMHNCTYMVLEVHSPETGDDAVDLDKVQEQVYDIVHHRMKKCMMMQAIEKRIRGKKGACALRVQTLCANGNTFCWDQKYDWNILAKKYVDQDGRKLAWQDCWQYIEKEFMVIKTALNGLTDVKWRIHFNCHLSIAFKLGQIYGDLGQASGNRNLILVSSNRMQNTEFVLNREMHIQQVSDFCQICDGNSEETADIVCIISIKLREKSPILDTVRQFMERQGKKYCKICLFQKEMSINDADTLESMAAYLRQKIISSRPGSDCKVHLFPDTTAPLMFALGARSVFPGTIQLYEYNPKGDTYEESLTN